MGEPTELILRPRNIHEVLLKLGSEMFGGGAVGLDPDVVAQVARQIAEVVHQRCSGRRGRRRGNFLPGRPVAATRYGARPLHYMGMLGTVMNNLALQDFTWRGHRHRVQTAITIGPGRRAYIPLRATATWRRAGGDRRCRYGSALLLHRHHRRPARPGDRRRVVLMAKAVDGVFTDDPGRIRMPNC